MSTPSPPPAAAAAADAAAPAAAAPTQDDASSFPANATAAFGAGLTIVDIDKKRGRGLVALQAFDTGDKLYTSHPDVAVLYTDFVKTHCAVCFRGRTALSKNKTPIDVCPRCDNFAVCATCCPDRDRNLGDAWRAHKLPCEWFMTLPESVRKGDTDYVRFLLDFCARAQTGDVTLLNSVMDCCALEDAHSAETKAFALQYATITANQFGPLGLRMPVEGLRDVLLRVKANAVGFPCNSSEIHGWAMEGRVCAANHSCVPNAMLQQDEKGHMTLRALRPVASGEEVTISYVRTEDYPDTKQRRRALLDKYRFLCMCPACIGGTPPTAHNTPLAKSPSTGTPVAKSPKRPPLPAGPPPDPPKP